MHVDTMLMNPTRNKQLSTVAVIVTRVKPVVRMRVGSGQTMELSKDESFYFQADGPITRKSS